MKVRIQTCKSERKKYLDELIGERYRDWWGKKVFIHAPTGIGKTTFILRNILPFFKRKGRKTLILCNRILLREQYWNNLLEQFDDYREIQQSVTVMTYQHLEEEVKRRSSLRELFNGYEAIVCDESHFFYSDSDFNGFGTFALLQAIACAGATKTMIFMSATLKEVEPLIVQTLENCMTILSRTGRNQQITDTNKDLLFLDYSAYADYKRFHCICVPDLETACGLLAESSKKSVIFLDNKEKATELKKLFIDAKKVDRRQIAILNADNINHECNRELIRFMTITHKLSSKILITTSVLDNGVSIHDPDVGNILILTESKCSFLQMLGRVRAESVEECKLYFVSRDAKQFSKRVARYEWEIDNFKKMDSVEQCRNWEKYMYAVWDRKDEAMADFYRKALVWMRHDDQFFSASKNGLRMRYGEANFYVNEFAKRKTEDMYMTESKFYALAMDDPIKVIYEQMAWIGKEPEELHIIESKYRKIREQDFIKELLAVQDFSMEDLKKWKKGFVGKYQKDFLIDIPAKNGTISNKKLQTICARYELEFKAEDDVNRQKKYTIERKNQEGEVE